MGQQISSVKFASSSKTPLKTRTKTSRSLPASDFSVQNSTKLSFFQKIKQKLAHKKASSTISQPNPVSLPKNRKSTLFRRENPFSTEKLNKFSFYVDERERELKKPSKESKKTGSLDHLEVKKRKPRLSLFDNLGISPQSPTTKRSPVFHNNKFDINNPNENIMSFIRKNPLKMEKSLKNVEKIEKKQDLPEKSMKAKLTVNTNKEFSVTNNLINFQSPLIKTPNIRNIQSSDLGAELVYNYSSYLNQKKSHNDFEFTLKKEKAMKEMMQSQNQKNYNFKFEFDCNNNRSKQTELINEERKALESYKQEKFRKELFENKLSPKNISQFFSNKLFSDVERRKSIVKSPKSYKDREFKFESLSPINTKLFNSSNGLSSASHFSKNYYTDANDSIKFEENSSMVSQKPRIFASPNFKEIMRKEHLVAKSLHERSETEELLKEKPKFIVKNKKTIVIFKNKILQIEPDEKKQKESVLQEKEPLFMKIVRSGQTPTAFVLKQERKNKSP